MKHTLFGLALTAAVAGVAQAQVSLTFSNGVGSSYTQDFNTLAGLRELEAVVTLGGPILRE